MLLRNLRKALLSVLAASACVLAVAGTASAADLGPLNQPVSAKLIKQLRAVSKAGLQQSPAYKSSALMAIDDQQAPLTNAPLVLYVGADFCPYCAALRWPLAIALMRFGHFSGLRYMRSSGSDVFANTATFSFYGAHLNSAYLQFEPVEVEDREENALQKPTAQQRDLFARFDTQPYTQSPGSIPFLYLGGQYLEDGSPFSPKPLQGLDWQQVVAKLKQGNNPVWNNIIGDANLLTAAMCKLTDGKPADVCTAPGIKAAAKTLPH